MGNEGANLTKVALVTGAARGMGRAIALALAKQGASIIAADIDLAGAESTAAAVVAGGGAAIALEVDLASRSSIERMFREAAECRGRLDILVNNAAVIGYASVFDLAESEWDRVLAVNLKASFECSRLAAMAMREQGGGVIVNISSISAELPEPDCIHYGVSKAGLAYMTKTLAMALAPHGIRVVAVCPGTIRTPMNEDLLRDPDFVALRLGTIPLQRVGRAEDVAQAVAFLASDAASYVTGSTLYVDGGMMLMR